MLDKVGVSFLGRNISNRDVQGVAGERVHHHHDIRVPAGAWQRALVIDMDDIEGT